MAHWIIEPHSFYNDSEYLELIVYGTAKCSECAHQHYPKEIFSKSIFPPDEIDDLYPLDAYWDFRFDEGFEKEKALREFKERNYKFLNYCPNCGANMNTRDCPLCDSHHGCDNCYYGQVESKELHPHCEDCEHNGDEVPTQWQPLDDIYCRKCGRKLSQEVQTK